MEVIQNLYLFTPGDSVNFVQATQKGYVNITVIRPERNEVRQYPRQIGSYSMN